MGVYHLQLAEVKSLDIHGQLGEQLQKHKYTMFLSMIPFQIEPIDQFTS